MVKPAASLDLKAGDTIHLAHWPERYQETFGASTPYADLVPGDVRAIAVKHEPLHFDFVCLARPK